MISKIWLIQKSDGGFIDYVYTTKQLAECRTRHQQDGATLTIQEWVLADRPALSRETPDPRRTPDPLIPQISTEAPECSPFPVMDHYREEQLEAALSAPQVGENVASLSAEEIFIRTVIRLTCNDGCEHNEECEQDKIDDYVRTQLPRLLAAERNRARRETKRMSSFQKGTKVLIRGEVLNDLQDKLGFVIVEVGDAQGRTPAIPASLLTLADRPAPSGEASRNVETNRRYGHKDDCKFGMENLGFCSCGKGFGEAKVDAQATFDALKKSREPHAPDMRTVDSEGFIESAPQAGEDDLIWARHYLRDGGPHDAAESTEEAAKLLAAERAAERNRAIEDTEKLRADLKEAQAGEDTPIRVKREWGSRRVIKRAIDWFRAHPGESWENLPPATLSLYFWLNDVWSDGFEAAHALRKCGHSVGDYRDSNYIPGKPSTYKAQESCVGCADRDRARREALEEAANLCDGLIRESFAGDVHQKHAYLAWTAPRIRALATRTGETERHE